MPIATCHTDASLGTLDTDAIVKAWSRHAAIASDEMTVHVVQGSWGGRRYSAIAHLLVPSIWTTDESTRLSLGLASALTEILDTAPNSVLVTTTVLESGSVVENGAVVCW